MHNPVIDLVDQKFWDEISDSIARASYCYQRQNSRMDLIFYHDNFGMTEEVFSENCDNLLDYFKSEGYEAEFINSGIVLVFKNL